MQHISLVSVFLVLSVSSLGQQRGSLSDQNPMGSAKVIVTPAANPSTLDDLVRMSNTILCGTVTSDSATRAFGQGLARRSMVITEVRVAVDRVIKGEVRAKAGNLLLSQIGGRSAEGELLVVNDELVSDGENYVLFLLDDEGQADRPNTSNLPRYTVAGVWSGKARIVDRRIRFLPAAHPDLRKMDGMKLDDFIAAIETALKPAAPTAKLPIHPGGGKLK